MNLPASPTRTEATFETTIAYLAPMKAFPGFRGVFVFDKDLELDVQPVTVFDARAIPGGASLDEHGFEVFPLPKGLGAPEDGQAFKDRYSAAVTEVVQQATGAAEVLIITSTILTRGKERQSGEITGLTYGSFCHSDFTPGGAARKIAEVFPERASEILSRGYAAYNVWQVLTPPPQDAPLALCDARSVAPRDLVTGESSNGGWGELGLFYKNPAHQWYHYPNMTSEECLIFCGFHSDAAKASIVPHLGVKNAACPPDTPPRRSVECRVIAVF